MTKLYFAIDDALVVLTTEGDHARCDCHLQGKDVGCVTVDPLCPQLVYCGTLGSGLWRSDNGGQSWRPAGEGIRHSRVQSVAVSRSERVKNRGIVYAGTEPSAIFRSEDAGQTWEECSDLTTLPSASEWSFPPRPETHHVRWIEADPHLQGRLFVAVEAGALIRSRDSGTTWQDRTAHGPRDSHQLSIHLSAPERLYSAAGDGYFESRDGGETWQQFKRGLRHRYLWSIAIDPADPDNIILQQPLPRGNRTLSRRNLICIGARAVLRGRNSAMACPSPSDATPPFWLPIRASRERSSRPGSATYFARSMAALTGIVWM
jgi:hypothetical protein